MTWSDWSRQQLDFVVFKIGGEKGKEIKEPTTHQVWSLSSLNAELIVSPEGKETGHETGESQLTHVCSGALNLVIYTELHSVYLKRAAVGDSGLHYPP